MPNTLVHLGIQSLASRSVFRDSSIKWIFLGSVISDIPWILQRIIHMLFPLADPYDLRLYAIVQASFAVSLLLCGSLAILSRRPMMIFSLLTFNCLLHLLLDASESKWGNGVHLFAPYSWKLVNFGFFWPESPVIYALSLLGLWISIAMLWREPDKPSNLMLHSPPRMALSAGLLAAYVLLPLGLLDGPEASDSHSVATLLDRENRDGRVVAGDRNQYIERSTGDVVRTFAGEDLWVTGDNTFHTGGISFQGRFSGPDHLILDKVHLHDPWLRDGASYIGLFIVLLAWLMELRSGYRVAGNVEIDK